MTVDKDRLIIELGSKLTEAAKICAEITKDHSPAEQSVEKGHKKCLVKVVLPFLP